MILFKRKPKFNSVYSKDITKVHNEFMHAGEKLYEEAIKIIDSIKINNLDKVNRLKKIGFNNTQEVKEAEEKIAKKEMSEKLAEAIKNYSIKYPLNRFITKEQVEKICKKYGLVYGAANKYKGFIPEKNLKMIEDFQKKYTFPKMAICRPYYLTEKDQFIFSMKNYTLKHDNSHYTYYYKDKHAFQQDNSNYDGINFYGTIYLNNNESIDGRVEILELQIAAPAKDFDLKDMEIKKYKIVKKVPDPVVLQPVEGGYLIITAWGDEASDENIVNPINN